MKPQVIRYQNPIVKISLQKRINFKTHLSEGASPLLAPVAQFAKVISDNSPLGLQQFIL